MKNRYDTIIEKHYDVITEVKKFNQNHDSLGRFSSGGGGGASGNGGNPLGLKKASAQQFADRIQQAKESQSVEKQWRVDAHDASDYEGNKNFISNGGSTVSVTPDGDIISVCGAKGDPRGKGDRLMEFAVENGGTKLDSFAGNHDFYERNGFQAVSSTSFSDEYAPPGWKESGCGKEDVVAYKYVGKGNVEHIDVADIPTKTKRFEGENGYDEMIAYRDSQIGGK